jgi:hypothetical protein
MPSTTDKSSVDHPISYPTIPFTKVSEEKTLIHLLKTTPNASTSNMDHAQTLLLYRLYPDVAPKMVEKGDPQSGTITVIEKESPIIVDDDHIRAELVFNVRKLVKRYPVEVSNDCTVAV